MRKFGPFGFYFFYFASFAFIAPFVVLYYQSNGFSGAQIGFLAGITPLVTLICAPLWTAWADATRRHRLIMSLTIIVGGVAIAAFPLLNTFLPVLLLSILFNAFFAPISSFADSATMFMLAEEKAFYGRIRVGGTIGFGVAATLAGMLIQGYGLRWAFWGCAALLIIALILSQWLRHSQTRPGERAPGGPASLLRNPQWYPFLTLAFAGGLAISAANTYLSAYLSELGAAESIIGLALTIGTVAEVPILFFGHHLIRWLGAWRLLMLAMVVTALRLLLFSAAGTPEVVLWLQLLNGLTFPAMWLAGVAYADANAPAGLSATAQGLFSAMVFGCGTAVGGFAGGPLLEAFGGKGLYLIFGGVVLVIVGLVAFARHWLRLDRPSASDAPA